jgi:hypothetical protein
MDGRAFLQQTADFLDWGPDALKSLELLLQLGRKLETSGFERRHWITGQEYITQDSNHIFHGFEARHRDAPFSAQIH